MQLTAALEWIRHSANHPPQRVPDQARSGQNADGDLERVVEDESHRSLQVDRPAQPDHGSDREHSHQGVKHAANDQAEAFEGHQPAVEDEVRHA